MGLTLPPPVIFGGFRLEYQRDTTTGRLRCIYCGQPMTRYEGKVTPNSHRHNRRPTALSFGRLWPRVFGGLYERKNLAYVSRLSLALMRAADVALAGPLALLMLIKYPRVAVLSGVQLRAEALRPRRRLRPLGSRRQGRTHLAQRWQDAPSPPCRPTRDPLRRGQGLLDVGFRPWSWGCGNDSSNR